MLPYIVAGKAAAAVCVPAPFGIPRPLTSDSMPTHDAVVAQRFEQPPSSIPIPFSGTDLLEDALQVSATLAYSAAPSAAATSAPAWSALVGAASTVSQLKWALVPPISGFLVLLAGGALAAALRPHADGKDL